MTQAGLRTSWVTLAAGAALAALALGLALWSKELTKEARRAECSARAQTITLRVQRTLEERLRGGTAGALARTKWSVKQGQVGEGVPPPPAAWLEALARHQGATTLSLSEAGGGRAASYLPAGTPGEGLLVEWNLKHVEREVIGPALSEAGAGRYAAVLLLEGDPEPTTFRARAQTPLFPPLASWSVGVGFADRSAVSRDLRIQTGLLSALVLGLLLALVVSLMASARRVRRRAQRALVRDQFLVRATHELQTPLALLRAAAETIQTGSASDPEARERCLAIVVREQERLTRTIRRLLRTLRWESWEAADLARWGPLVPALGDAAEALRPALREAGLELELELGDLEREAAVDLAADTVTELLSNALKHAEGATRVVVRLSLLSGTRALLEVQDDGPGLDAPIGAPESFTQAEGSTPGSGLGLALLREGWTLLGGQITLADRQAADAPGSEGKRGALFRVEIPLR
ncbi:MAG: HAMP domain-containing histidine kinase [Planctomycetes bacterium]|nr:HAMP domain-containing histidine kinase [Planctomycetota bacterium]